MSLVLRNIEVDLSKEVEDENLVPVSDEELEGIIEELGDELVAEIEEAMDESELPPEMLEILNAETVEERVRLYNKYYDILFPEN